jgi:hypothetical protein
MNIDSKKGNNGTREQAAVGRQASATADKLEICEKKKSQQMHVHLSTSIRHEKSTTANLECNDETDAK